MESIHVVIESILLSMEVRLCCITSCIASRRLFTSSSGEVVGSCERSVLAGSCSSALECVLVFLASKVRLDCLPSIFPMVGTMQCNCV